MKIAIIAANGRTGMAFLNAALAAGHRVRAGVRGFHNLTPHDMMELMECDATKKRDVLRLIDGVDAVVSLMGHVPGSPAYVQRDAAKVVVTCMQEKGITRLVSLTGTGVRQPGDEITFMDKVLNMGIRIVDEPRVNDGIAHAHVLEESDIEYTIIRVLKLIDGRAHQPRLSEHGPAKTLVAREEVAQAILDVLRDETWVRKMPIVSK